MDRLWYKRPARIWPEALPLGNGYTGVMVFGGVRRERLALNDVTLWSGYPKDQTNPESLRHLERVRELIFAGRHAEADQLARERLHGDYGESYLPLGDLLLRFGGTSRRGYRRELNLAEAVHTVETHGLRRDCFASYPDRVVVYRIESQRPFSLRIDAESKLQGEITVDEGLNLLGNAPSAVAPNYLGHKRNPLQYDEGKGMSFCLRVLAETNGTLHRHARHLSVTGATQVTLRMTTATGYLGFDRMPNTQRSYALELCKQRLEQGAGEYQSLKQRHLEDYQRLWQRQEFRLLEHSDQPTDQLVKEAKRGRASNALLELFYKFGKYLMISGSRDGGQPLNLQGIWNANPRPPWSSNYTVNINTEMNYWPAAACGLEDCIEPFRRMLGEVMVSGRRTARVNYGCEGFACNHNVDLWRKTTPVKGDPAYMYAPLCGVWLANELYALCKTGKIRQHQAAAEEVITEALRFVKDFLVLQEGRYVICPSSSPEASFLHEGSSCALDYASAYDMGLVRQLLQNYMEFAPAGPLRQSAEDILPLLRDFACGSTGLLEWHCDHPISEKGHRHFSPLYAFYPGRVLRYFSDPEQVAWVRQLFAYRCQHSHQHIGWSAAWAACLAARLHEGEHALSLLRELLKTSVFSNLFDVHQPLIFQIDGNFGALAGINEMLVYCENGVVELLPALPKDWPQGEVRGMMVNGAALDFKWSGGRVTYLHSSEAIRVLRGSLAEECRLSEGITLADCVN